MRALFSPFFLQRKKTKIPSLIFFFVPCFSSQVSWRTIPPSSESPLSTPPPHFGVSHDVISYPFDRIKRLYDINVHGAFFTAREAARNMIPQGGGSIVLVASMSANVRA